MKLPAQTHWPHWQRSSRSSGMLRGTRDPRLPAAHRATYAHRHSVSSMREAEGGGPVGPRPGPSRGPKIKYLLIRTLHTGLPCAPRALRVSRPPQPTSPAHYKDSYTPLALSARPLVRLCPIGANRSSFPLAAGRCDVSSADPPSILRSTPHTPGPRRCS